MPFTKHPYSEVYLSGNYVGRLHPPLGAASGINYGLCADQAPDQVPYNDETESEGEYALDEVSSDVELNPEDMVDLPSDEDEEDTGWAPQSSTLLS